ncbi:HDIG domain-containing metalloprotein [Kitasatospora sp. NPDC018619]|uniref:HDIG domain-containing metalloprotein n=1 Tax=unclassified Kitasatospora TaxID=2633591 RepID=UPI00378C2899
MTTHGLPPLPADVAVLLRELDAPPGLVAHLALVHAVAEEIAGFCAREGLVFEREAVRYGAATHDIGRTVHVEERSAPGSRHEAAGYALLRARGVPERLAAFGRTHASRREPGVTTESLPVSLADKAWKNRRVRSLEDPVVERLAAGGRERWEAFLAPDDLLTRIAEDAPGRLALQGAHSARTG